MPSSPRDELLTVREVCAELKIQRSTFYDWRQKGIAPPSKKLPNLGIRVRRSDLEKWINSLPGAA